MEYALSIRDEIHDYIRLNSVEANVIETPIFQRLRNISQNGFAHFVYPSFRVYRFEHSLGCCHIASKIIESSLANKSKGRDRFIRACRTHGFNKRGTEDHIIKITRLAALLHDLGHLPLSHSFENEMPYILDCLSDKDTLMDLNKYPRLAYHEYATLKLLENDSLLKKAIKKKDRELVYRILSSAPEEQDSPFSAIKVLLDSDIDIDRSDFILRDGNEIGPEFGRYDLTRLIDNMKIHYDSTLSRFLILPTRSALSVLQRFLVERYNLYKWVYFHHHVYFISTILARVVRLLGEGIRSGNWDRRFEKFVRTNLNKLSWRAYIDKKTKLPNDDVWFLNFLRGLYVRLRRKRSFSLEERLLHRSLEYLIFRKKISKALWKTDLDYESFNDILHDVFYLDKERWRSWLHNFASIELKRRFLFNFIRDNAHTKRLESYLNSKLTSADHYLILAPLLEFQVYKEGPTRLHSRWAVLHEESSGKIIPQSLTSVAPIVLSLRDLWKQTPQIYVYVIFLNDVSTEERRDFMEALKPEIAKYTVEFIADGRQTDFDEWLAK